MQLVYYASVYAHARVEGGWERPIHIILSKLKETHPHCPQ